MKQIRNQHKRKEQGKLEAVKYRMEHLMTNTSEGIDAFFCIFVRNTVVTDMMLIDENNVQVPLTGDVDRRLLESTGCLFVKQRAGYLSYAVDPKVCIFCIIDNCKWMNRYVIIHLSEISICWGCHSS